MTDHKQICERLRTMECAREVRFLAATMIEQQAARIAELEYKRAALIDFFDKYPSDDKTRRRFADYEAAALMLAPNPPTL